MWLAVFLCGRPGFLWPLGQNKALRVRHTRTCCSRGGVGTMYWSVLCAMLMRSSAVAPGCATRGCIAKPPLRWCSWPVAPNAQTAVYRHAFAGTCGAGEPPAHAEHHQRARTPTHCCPFSCLFDAPLRVASASVQMFSDLRSLHQLTQSLKGDGVFEVSRLCVVTVPRASARLPVSMSQS